MSIGYTELLTNLAQLWHTYSFKNTYSQTRTHGRKHGHLIKRVQTLSVACMDMSINIHFHLYYAHVILKLHHGVQNQYEMTKTSMKWRSLIQLITMQSLTDLA